VRRRAAALLAAALLAAGLVAGCATPRASAPPLGPGPPGATSPPGASAAAGPTGAGSSRPFRPTPAPAPTFATYLVRPGDTLTALAARFGTTPESLAYWNRARYPSLDPDAPTYRPDRIEAGWRLVYLPGAVVDPEDLPPAPGQPTPGDGIVAVGAFPTLPPNGSAALVRRGPAGLRAVAITFEYRGGAGAGPGGAEAIAQWLAANDVPATVFVAGAAAEPADGAAAAVLHRLGGAQQVRPGLLASVADAGSLGAALAAADAGLAAATGRTTAPWLRPAGGDATAAALLAAGAAGWTWCVLWDVDPGDGIDTAGGGPIAADIVAGVVSRATGGSIVRLQLGGPHTLEALPDIVDGLAAKGLRPAPLAAVVGLEPPPGG